MAAAAKAFFTIFINPAPLTLQAEFSMPFTGIAVIIMACYAATVVFFAGSVDQIVKPVLMRGMVTIYAAAGALALTIPITLAILYAAATIAGRCYWLFTNGCFPYGHHRFAIAYVSFTFSTIVWLHQIAAEAKRLIHGSGYLRGAFRGGTQRALRNNGRYGWCRVHSCFNNAPHHIPIRLSGGHRSLHDLAGAFVIQCEGIFHGDQKP
jgi:hypothetical protein